MQQHNVNGKPIKSIKYESAIKTCPQNPNPSSAEYFASVFGTSLNATCLSKFKNIF